MGKTWFYYLEKSLQGILVLIFILLTVKFLGLQGLAYFIITIGVLLVLIYLKWKKIRQKGLIWFFGEGAKKILLQRSILDIFRDLVYFPYLLKIISTIFSVITSKPHPQSIPLILRTLPPQVQQIATRKGLLSLMPQVLEQLILSQNRQQILTVNYGKNEEQWDRKDEYHLGDNLVHQQTFQKKIVHFLDGKFGWITVLVLMGGVLTGIKKMKYRNFKKMVIHNATFYCLVLTLLALLIKIRKHLHTRKKKTQIVIKVKSEGPEKEEQRLQ